MEDIRLDEAKFFFNKDAKINRIRIQKVNDDLL